MSQPLSIGKWGTGKNTVRWFGGERNIEIAGCTIQPIGARVAVSTNAVSAVMALGPLTGVEIAGSEYRATETLVQENSVTVVVELLRSFTAPIGPAGT